MTTTPRNSVFVGVAILLLLQSCSDLGIPVPPAPFVRRPQSFANDIHPILLANCAISGCHAGSTPLAGFNQETYTGVRAGGATFGVNVVQPGDSSYSSSSTNVGSGIMKMLRNVNNPFGNFRMPQGGPFVATGLPDTMIVKIGIWIMQGAPNN